MKRIKTLTMAVCMMTATGATAQTAPEEVKSPIVEEKTAEWYDGQIKAWGEVVKTDPKNENAWRNYYQAANYKRWQDNTDTTAVTVLAEMKKAVPDSYIYNYCAYREYMGTPEDTVYAEKAIARMQEKMGYDEYNTWIAYFAKENDTRRLADICKAYYESGQYSPGILQYNYNELQGMDEGGIYIGVGDAVVIPKWLLQYGKGVHTDKIIVCVPFLYMRKYREQLFRQLGIGEVPKPEVPITDEDSSYKYLLQLLRYIRVKSGRSVYYSPLSGMDLKAPVLDSLYNEGLVLKYSDKPYDNMAVKCRNVEQKYLLEYLRESFVPDNWISAKRMSVNYAIMLCDLLPYYKTYDKARYEWLMTTLRSAIKQASLPLEEEEKFMKMLDK